MLNAIIPAFTHPCSYDMIDDLMLMLDGRVAYLGPACKAVEYFSGIGHPLPSEYNPADHFMKILQVGLLLLVSISGNVSGPNAFSHFHLLGCLIPFMLQDPELGPAALDLWDQNAPELVQKDEDFAALMSPDQVQVSQIPKEMLTKGNTVPVQFVSLMQRSFRNTIRNKGSGIAALIQSIVVGLIIRWAATVPSLAFQAFTQPSFGCIVFAMA